VYQVPFVSSSTGLLRYLTFDFRWQYLKTDHVAVSVRVQELLECLILKIYKLITLT
jgi:hypothetical protein